VGSGAYGCLERELVRSRRTCEERGEERGAKRGGGLSVIGEAERGAKQRADNISIRDESRAGSYFRSSRASSLTTVTILILDPNPFRDSLRLSQH